MATYTMVGPSGSDGPASRGASAYAGYQLLLNRASRSTSSLTSISDDSDPRASGEWSARAGTDLIPEVVYGDFHPDHAVIDQRSTVTLDSRRRDAQAGTGAFIPAAYFRTVRGVCVDTEGKPITKGEYLLAFGGLPTVGQVDDQGRFSVPVLKNTYTDFVLVTSSGREGVDYAWFTPVDTRVPSYQDEATLIFERRELTGLYAGQATQMGGSLR